MTTVRELREMYFDLVWYARKPRENGKVTLEHAREVMPDTPDDILQRMVQAAKRIEEMYPNEVAALNDQDLETRNWAHGFNSGMLAALRLVKPSVGISNRALEDFPALDS